MTASRVKKISAAITCLILTLSLSSCKYKGRYQKRDLDAKIIVHAIGIDKTEDGDFEVTMQILSQQGSGSLTPIDPSQSNSATVSQVSQTIPSAIEQCETDLGKKVFLGHSELILLGSSVDDLTPIMEFLVNTQGISLGIIMAYTDVTAKEILDIKITSGTYSAEALKEAFEESQKNGTSTECELIRHINNIENTNGTTVVPIIKKINDDKQTNKEKESESSDSDMSFGESSNENDTEAGNEKVKNESGESSQSDSSQQDSGGEKGSDNSQESEMNAFYVDGAVIVKNRKPRAVMTRDEVIGLSFIRSNIARQTIDAHLQDGLPTAAAAGSVKKKTDLSIEDGRIVIDIKLTISYEFYKTYSEEQKESLKDDVTYNIKEMCDKAVNKALKEESADLFDINSLLNHNDYVLYEEYKKNPEEILKKVDIRININPQI